jgi:hypothetical protein
MGDGMDEGDDVGPGPVGGATGGGGVNKGLPIGGEEEGR